MDESMDLSVKSVDNEDSSESNQYNEENSHGLDDSLSKGPVVMGDIDRCDKSGEENMVGRNLRSSDLSISIEKNNELTGGRIIQKPGIVESGHSQMQPSFLQALSLTNSNLSANSNVSNNMSAIAALTNLSTNSTQKALHPLLMNVKNTVPSTSLLQGNLPPGRYVLISSSTTPSAIQTTNTNTTAISVTNPPPSNLSPNATESARTAALNKILSMRNMCSVGRLRSVGKTRGLRKSYTTSEKLAMIEAVESGLKKSVVADAFGVAPSTLACIVLQRDKIRRDQSKSSLNRRRIRPSVLAKEEPPAPSVAPDEDSNEPPEQVTPPQSSPAPPPFTHFLANFDKSLSFGHSSPEEIVAIPDLSQSSFLPGSSTPPRDTGPPPPSPIIPLSPSAIIPPLPQKEPQLEEPVKCPESPDLPEELSLSCDPSAYLVKRQIHCHSILDELLRDETYTDVAITADGQTFSAHKIVLCMASSYFKRVLNDNNPGTRNVVILQGISAHILKNLLHYLYTGEATIESSDLENFMNGAKLLEINSLCDSLDQKEEKINPIRPSSSNNNPEIQPKFHNQKNEIQPPLNSLISNFLTNIQPTLPKSNFMSPLGCSPPQFSKSAENGTKDTSFYQKGTKNSNYFVPDSVEKSERIVLPNQSPLNKLNNLLLSTGFACLNEGETGTLKTSNQISNNTCKIENLTPVNITVSEPLVKFDAKISPNEAKIGPNEAKIGTNEAKIGTNKAKIGTNEAQIGTNEAKIGSNEVKNGRNEAKIALNEAEEENEANPGQKEANGDLLEAKELPRLAPRLKLKLELEDILTSGGEFQFPKRLRMEE